MQIIQLSHINETLEQLSELLIDCVQSGASVGFLPPLTTQQARDYWQQVKSELLAGNRKLLVAKNGEQTVGAVQLALTSKANGNHRAEVEKLMVHTSARGQGLSKALMQALEQLALDNHRELLVLDTRVGDLASTVYRKLGYQEAGQIPNFARSASGKLEATVYFYKQLKAVNYS
jgi:acetyltransferase